MGLLRRTARHDVPAEAEVLGLAPTRRGARQTEQRDVEHALELRVLAPDGRAVEVTHVCRVPWDRIPLVGTAIPVTFTGGEPYKLRVCWDEIPSIVDRSRASAEASRRGDAAGAAAALGLRLRDDD